MPYIPCPACGRGYETGHGRCPCTMPRNETEAFLAMEAAAYDRAMDAAVKTRILELAREDVPPDPPIRQPGEPVRIAIGEAKVPPADFAIVATMGGTLDDMDPCAACGEVGHYADEHDAVMAERDRAGELAREDVRPGMRRIGGTWFYSSAWL